MPAPEGRVQVERSVSGTGRRGGWGVLCLCAGGCAEGFYINNCMHGRPWKPIIYL